MRRGTDNFTLPVALKIFSPERYEDGPRLRRGDGPHGGRGGPRRPDPARQSAGRPQFGRSQPHPPDGDGVGRRLRPEPAADRLDARAHAVPREEGPLELPQQRDRHRRAAAAAAQAGRGHRRRPRLPGGPGRAAPRGHRPRRHEAVEHHAQADRQRQDRRHRLGVRDEQPARPADLHADLRRAGGARRRRVYAAERPGEPGLRADRDAGRPLAVRQS